jgi:hypothetical protein
MAWAHKQRYCLKLIHSTPSFTHGSCFAFIARPALSLYLSHLHYEPNLFNVRTTVAPLPLSSTLSAQSTLCALPQYDHLRQVLLRVRCAMDPFLAYRVQMAASAISEDDLTASEDANRVSLAPEARGLRFQNTNFCPVSLLDDQVLVTLL